MPWPSPFATLGSFISRYFILFVTVVNGILSLISLSDFSLLVYRNAKDFCLFILYLATLLNLLISSSNLREKAMAPHSSTLTWKIPWTEKPGGLQSMGSHRVRHD